MKTLEEIYDDVKDAWSSRELFDQRLNICKQCDSYIALTMQCGECKCFIPVKAHITHAKCPRAIWPGSEGFANT